MPLNWTGVLAAAFIPAVIRLIWYHPKLFGAADRHAVGLEHEAPIWKQTLLPLCSSAVLGFFVASILMPLVIHQIHVFSIMQSAYGRESAQATVWLTDFMAEYGSVGRTFRHGAVHGALAGLFLATPMIATNAIFERRGSKYILINGGYWTVCLALMGSILCGWS